MRTITVVGTGRFTARPDEITVTLTLTAERPEYAAAMALAEQQLEALRAALLEAGFAKEQLKTSDFSVDARYENRPDDRGGNRRVFAGYAVRHGLQLRFPLDTKRLASVLEAATKSGGEPQLGISFGLADSAAAANALLADAAKNARARAEALAAAFGAKLGALLEIRCGQSGCAPLASPTAFALNARFAADGAGGIDAEPQDIALTDEATFVWELA